jgi:hypothetical protein
MVIARAPDKCGVHLFEVPSLLGERLLRFKAWRVAAMSGQAGLIKTVLFFHAAGLQTLRRLPEGDGAEAVDSLIRLHDAASRTRCRLAANDGFKKIVSAALTRSAKSKGTTPVRSLPSILKSGMQREAWNGA